MSLPEIKIIVDTSNSYFSGTNDEVKIVFRKYICSGERETPNFKIDIVEIPLLLNKKGKIIKAGSSNVYSFRDSRFKDISYAQQFTLEKSFTFLGKVVNINSMPVPIGLRFSNNWKVKRVRVYYNNTLALDNTPTNSERNSVWLNKINYWITFPDPNNGGPNECGVCGCDYKENYQYPNFIFRSEGVL